jgi:hypothetical protein
MNKLYLLGALMLSTVEASKFVGSTSAATTATMPLGSYTYTITGDCYSAGTATTLGMNNKFYQYYTFDINAGTKAFAASTPIAGAGSIAHTYAYAGCYHTHLYNWMATPVMGSSTF